MFLADYNDNRREATATQIEDSLVATALLEFAHRMDDWTGTASDCFLATQHVVGKKIAASARWPKSPGVAHQRTSRIAPQLRMHGISVEFCRTHQGRVLSLTKLNRCPEIVDTANL